MNGAGPSETAHHGRKGTAVKGISVPASRQHDALKRKKGEGA